MADLCAGLTILGFVIFFGGLLPLTVLACKGLNKVLSGRQDRHAPH